MKRFCYVFAVVFLCRPKLSSSEANKELVNRKSYFKEMWEEFYSQKHVAPFEKSASAENPSKTKQTNTCASSNGFLVLPMEK